MPRLSTKEWDNLIDFYDDGHTMQECANVWRISIPAISLKFKKIGKKARPRFFPSRPEKLEGIKNPILLAEAKEKFKQEEQEELSGLTPEGSCRPTLYEASLEEDKSDDNSKRKVVSI